MAFRFVALFVTSFLLIFAVACSDDDDNGGSATGSTGSSATGNTGAQPPASRPDYCDELDTVRGDVDELQSAMRSLDRSAAESAVQDLRTDLEQLRDAARDGGDNEEVDQAAGDLAGAVQGLETTLRQATQGDASLTGVIQELETQFPAIMSSLNDLRTEARCN
jgi:chromosome segregation ATPase